MFTCFKDHCFFKRFLKISLPVMLSAFVTFLVTFLDNIMVGTVSENAVSGVYAANQVSYLFNLSLFGLLEGAGIFIQQFMGAKDTERLKESFRYKIVVTLLFALVVMPMVYFFGGYLITYYSKSDTNYEAIYYEAMDYLRILAISYIPYMIGYIYSTSLRETGDTKYAMYASLIAIFANTIFNAIFIMALSLGVKGAAYATIIARVLEMLFLLFICYYKKLDFCHQALRNFHISKEIFKNLTKKGWLLFINEIGFAIGNILQTLAFSQRDGVLAAISVVTTISNIFGILIQGLSVAIGVMVGSRLGANEFSEARDEAKKLNYLGMYMSILVGLILIATSFFLPHVFIEVSKEQKLLATKLIIIYGTLVWANCLALTFYFVLRAGGQVILTFIFDTGMMFILYVPVSLSLAYFTNLDTIYIYLIVRAIDIVKMLIGLVFIRKEGWVRNLTLIPKNS